MAPRWRDAALVLILLGVLFAGPAGPSSALAATVPQDNGKPQDNGNLGEEIYLMVPPVNISLFDHGRPAGILTISVQLKVVDAKKRAEALRQMPRLSDLYLRKANRLSLEYFDINRPINVALLTRVYQQATDRLLKHGDARVLISNVVVQKR
ncbi:hypothetical protein [Luteithermobacter gelatinilyticus]|uniref:hypothetical protein n=1 Tax=Luteithermobacter gelatinilyticus TaxID=2582913 RepID=UPI001105FCAB|nr:hypothetical protein [Luteithermobacter gelatinilyticus]